MSKGYWIHIICITGSIILASSAQANSGDKSFEFSATGGVAYLDWKEFDQNGERTLAEGDARLNVIGYFGNRYKIQNPLLYGAQVTLHLDIPDEPLSDDGPVYNPGIALQGEIGYRVITTGQFAWDLNSNMEFEYFEIQETYENSEILDDSNTVLKSFNVITAKLGTGFTWIGKKRNQRLVIGFKLPLYIDESIDSIYSTGYYTSVVDLQPKGRVSNYLAYTNTIILGKMTRLKFTLFYDSYRFDASDETTAIIRADNTPTTVKQPDTHQDIYGFAIGVQWW